MLTNKAFSILPTYLSYSVPKFSIVYSRVRKVFDVPPEAFYNTVLQVDKYKEFLPVCEDSSILSK